MKKKASLPPREPAAPVVPRARQERARERHQEDEEPEEGPVGADARAQVPPAAVGALAVLAARVRDLAVGGALVPVLVVVPARVVVRQGRGPEGEHALPGGVPFVVELAEGGVSCGGAGGIYRRTTRSRWRCKGTS